MLKQTIKLVILPIMKLTGVLFILLCFGCQTKKADPAIHISLINNNQSLKITGINTLILQDIARDTSNNWQTLVPVFKMPLDTDLKNYQPAQAGSYSVKQSDLIFTPDTPFSKRQTYFLRYYNYTGDDNPWHIIKNKARPGKLHYIDLIFKQ